LELIARASGRAGSIAIRAGGHEHTYGDLVRDAQGLAAVLLRDRADLAEDRVAHLCEPGYPYVVTQWAIWLAGGVAVPLATSHPEAELAYAIDHVAAGAIVADTALRERVAGLAASRGLPLVDPSQRAAPGPDGLPSLAPDRRAIVFFTSGTTGRQRAPSGTTPRSRPRCRCSSGRGAGRQPTRS